MKPAAPFLKLSAAGAALLALSIGANGPAPVPAQARPAAEMVALLPGSLTYRVPGEYLASDRTTDAPLRETVFRLGFEMMKYQVSAADYATCVAQGACTEADGKRVEDDVPVTGVDYTDAEDYANWLSARTGESWRLPTDAEWAFAAAERFNDDTLGPVDDDANPAVRWLARYRKEAGNTPSDPEPKPQGHFGMNSKGLADMSGNVWDWTSTCYIHASVEKDGSLDRSVENCGVRVASGRHRAYMSFFLRDGKSGGCAAGMAPHNLGIRLVRDRPTLLVRMKAFFHGAG